MRENAEAGTVALRPAPESEAARSYNASLASDEALGRESAEALERAHQENGLIVGGRMLCNVLRPRFISRSRYAELARVADAVAGLFERAGDLLMASDHLLDLAGASTEEREVWSIDPGYPGYTPTSRLDSFMIGHDLQFLEYNAESPAGIGFCDRLTEIFCALPALKAWRGTSIQQLPVARERLLETLLWCYRQWGGTDVPSMAVIDWEDVLTKRDFELCAEYFRDHGVHTIITDPRKLEYRGGAVWCGNERISLIYRRVLLHELLDRAAEVQPLLRAYRDGAVCVVNSPRSKLLHKKSVFALLSDRRLGLQVSPEEGALLGRVIPWTRLLDEGETTYRDEPVDMTSLLLTHQDRFVIKPVDDYGGRGVVLGWDVSRESWERTIEHGMQGGFIVQERVPVPQAVFPIWQGGHLEEVPLFLDTDPLMFRGEMGAILTRLSGKALLNVTSGSGSAAPTFVLDEEEE